MEPSNQVFWGLIVKPGKRYEQIAEEDFHVSKACIEPSSAAGGVTSVYVEAGTDEYIIANLNSKNLSENLDLNFIAGENICFRSEGSGIIHLTGYINPENDANFSDFMDGEEIESEEEESEEEEVPELVNGKKRKNNEAAANGQEKKKKKGELSPLDKALAEQKKKGKALTGPQGDEEIKKAMKKAQELEKKLSKKSAEDEESDDEDDDDEDDDDEDDDEDDDMESAEGEEDDEDEDSEDEEEEEEEEVPTPKKGKDKTPTKQQNGKEKTPKKAEQTPSKKDGKTPKKEETATPNKAAKSPKRTLKGGVVVEDLKVGNGPEAKRGKTIGMKYEGRLQSNNKMFDGNFNDGKAFKFRLGSGEVIKGWDVGIEGMKVGGMRRIVIPPKFGYGPQGAMPDIPPNATLVFKVECKFVS